MTVKTAWCLIVLLAMLGCDSAPSASAADAADGVAPDALALDAAPDAAPDATPPDTAIVDAQPIDATPPDAQPIDAAIVDALPPDACAPACGELECGGDGCGGVCGVCEAAAPVCEAGRCLAPPAVVISELMARNDSGLEDEDGDAVDWLELHNPTRAPVDLAGWGLTDDLDAPAPWRFPEVTLPAGGRLVVFASGKDRAGDPLHTDFRLSGGGESIALLYRDGQTIVHAWAPFPAQHPDVSYGLSESVEVIPLVAEGDTARFRLPGAGEGWRAAAYDDAEWSTGPLALGFSRVAVAPAPEDLENVAAGRPTRQTSQLGGFEPGLAVNGDFADFTHTDRADAEPEWAVDLGAEQAVARVVVHNRRGCCGTRLRDITVALADADGVEVWASPLLNPEDALGAPPSLTVEPGVLAHEVRVRRTADLDLSGTAGAGNDDEATVLSLGEVEVFAGEGGVAPRITTDVSGLVGDLTRGLQVRVPFEVDDPSALGQLRLRVDHDAGFVAWINGVEVARVRAPEGPLAPDAEATAEAPELVTRLDLDLTADLGALRAGANVLAIHALTADDDDLLISPTLTAITLATGAPGYFPAPTPGAPNEGPRFDGLVAPAAFDAPHGWSAAPFALGVTTDTPGAIIHYTTDGSRPSDESPVYEGPLAIEGSTVIRAVATRPGWRPAPVATATYLFAADVVAQSREAVLARGFPEAWGGTAADYAVDPRVVGPEDAFEGRYAATIRDALRAVPTLAISTENDGLFGPEGIYTHSQASGLAWERPASLELIEAEGEGFQVDCGLRIQGGAFRSHGLTRKHSLRVLFKGAYGPTKLRWPLLGEEETGATDRFDTLTLRANSNDGWQWGAAGSQPLYIRDAFGRHTMLAMGGVASHAAFFHLFLDGVYWGLYEATERPDAAFSATYLGGDKGAWDGQNSGSAVDGDLVAWRALLARLAEGVGTLEDWFELQGLDAAGAPDPLRPAWIDMPNLADYMLTNLYVGNTDWPRKNFYVGRPRDGSLGFHFYMWDSEWSLGLRSTLDTDRVGVEIGVAQPWAAMRASPEFRLLVADRARAHLTTPGGALWVDPAAPEWDPQHPERNAPAARFAALAARVELPLVAESARWGDQHRAELPYTVDADWAVERDGLMADYFPHRTARLLAQLQAADLYPAVPPVAPSHWGGRVDVGFALDLTAADGDAVLYTVNGGDPRLPGGEISPTAVGGEAQARVRFDARTLDVEVQARARAADGTWSALTTLRFMVL